jgi:hypothetical protein
MQGNLNPFYLIPHTAMRTKLSLGPPFGKSDYNSILLIPAYKLKLKQEASVTRSIKKWSDEALLNYRTVLLTQTGICSGILPMALRSTPHQLLALSISASRKSPPQ